MEESLTINDGTVATVFRMYWSKTWCDITIQTDVEGETTARVFVASNPATLREIAEQLYSWADTVENMWETNTK